MILYDGAQRDIFFSDDTYVKIIFVVVQFNISVC